MKSALVKAIAAVLTEQVDGGSADRFFFHMQAHRDHHAFRESWPEAEQVRWMTAYWLQQVYSLGIYIDPEIMDLNAATDVRTFMRIFRRSVLPLIEPHNLPDVNLHCAPRHSPTVAPVSSQWEVAHG